MLMKIRSPFTFIQAEGHHLRQCTLVISSHLCSQSKLFLSVVLIKAFFFKETLNMACETTEMIHCKEFWLGEANINELNSLLTFSLKWSQSLHHHEALCLTALAMWRSLKFLLFLKASSLQDSVTLLCKVVPAAAGHRDIGLRKVKPLWILVPLQLVASVMCTGNSQCESFFHVSYHYHLSSYKTFYLHINMIAYAYKEKSRPLHMLLFKYIKIFWLRDLHLHFNLIWDKICLLLLGGCKKYLMFPW